MKNRWLIPLMSLLLLVAPAFADSQRIRDEFFDRLKSERDFGAYELDVDVRRGVFTVTGTVASEVSRARVGEIAEAIAGVDTVRNQVLVKGASPKRVVANPGSLSEQILSRVEREIGKENYSLKVAEKGDVLTLIGSVDTSAGAQKIARIAAEMAPEMRVQNQLAVREELLTDEELRARVLSALGREPLISTAGLEISARRGTVEISGVRPNHREIDRILSVIVMVEGVKDVDSKLRIGN